MSATPLRIAVLLSGEGTSLENLFEQIDAGAVPAQVVLVVASKPKAGGLARAQRRGVPALAVPRKKYPDPGAFNDALHAVLADYEIDLVALLDLLSRHLAGSAKRVGSVVRVPSAEDEDRRHLHRELKLAKKDRLAMLVSYAGTS